MQSNFEKYRQKNEWFATWWNLSKLSFKEYESLAGEVEARNVQTRINTPNKKLIRPWKTEDRPRSKQIIRKEWWIMMSDKWTWINWKITNSKELETKYKDFVEDLNIFENKTNIKLNMIKIKDKGKWIWSKIMTELIEYADAVNKKIRLTPEKIDKTSLTKLKSFYKRFGFIENKGSNKDFSISESMYRHPKPKVIKTPTKSAGLIEEAKKYKSADDIKTLPTKDFQGMEDIWDLERLLTKSWKDKKKWAEWFDFKEPVEVSISKEWEFIISDWHHRALAWKILDKEIPVIVKSRIDWDLLWKYIALIKSWKTRQSIYKSWNEWTFAEQVNNFFNKTPTKSAGLIEEAKKYKSADEFVNNIIDSKQSNTYNSLKEFEESVNLDKFNKVFLSEQAITKKWVDLWKTRINKWERPPVITGSREFWFPKVLDWHHRLEAYKQLGFEEIPMISTTKLKEIYKQAKKLD